MSNFDDIRDFDLFTMDNDCFNASEGKNMYYQDIYFR